MLLNISDKCATQIAKMTIDPKIVEFTADVVRIFFQSTPKPLFEFGADQAGEYDEGCLLMTTIEDRWGSADTKSWRCCVMPISILPIPAPTQKIPVGSPVPIRLACAGFIFHVIAIKREALRHHSTQGR